MSVRFSQTTFVQKFKVIFKIYKTILYLMYNNARYVQLHTPCNSEPTGSVWNVTFTSLVLILWLFALFVCTALMCRCVVSNGQRIFWWLGVHKFNADPYNTSALWILVEKLLFVPNNSRYSSIVSCFCLLSIVLLSCEYNELK